jgi:CRISPR-associated protein Cas1
MVSRIDLVVNGYGASVRKKSNRFIVEHDGQTREIPAIRVRQILITGSTSITSGAMMMAAGEDIDIVMCDREGTPVCRVSPCRTHGIVTTRRNQIAVMGTPAGYNFVTGIIRSKIGHMSSLLIALGRRRDDPDLRASGEEILRKLRTIPPGGSRLALADTLRGIEGDASHEYFSSLARVMPETIYRGRRSRQPAADPFNAYLNYGYGILYREVEKSCILAGLDPYAGVLHTDRYGNKAFVYDIIEQYRQPLIDRIVLTLAVRGQMEPADRDEKGYLTPDARRRIITAFISRYDEEREIMGRTTTFRDYIQNNARDIVRHLNEGAPYQPLEWRWQG